jgi:hypothetical protein
MSTKSVCLQIKKWRQKLCLPRGCLKENLHQLNLLKVLFLDAKENADKFYYAVLKTQPKPTLTTHYFTPDVNFLYAPFFADFGPLNMGMIHSFCVLLERKFEVNKIDTIG